MVGTALGASGLLVASAGLITYLRRNSRGSPSSIKDKNPSSIQGPSQVAGVGRFTGLGIQEVYGWERPYVMDERERQQPEDRETHNRKTERNRSIYEIESSRWM